MSPHMKSHNSRRENASSTTPQKNSHTSAKFHIDLTLDSDSASRDSDSDEPVFIGTKPIPPAGQNGRAQSQVKSQPQPQPQAQAKPQAHAKPQAQVKPQPQTQSRFGHVSLDRFMLDLQNGRRPVAREADRRGATATPQQQTQSASVSSTTQHNGTSAFFSGSTAANTSPASASAHPPHPRATPSLSSSKAAAKSPSATKKSATTGPRNFVVDDITAEGRFAPYRPPPAIAAAAASARNVTTVNNSPRDRPSTRDTHIAPPQITPPSSSRFDSSLQESPSAVAMFRHAKTTPKRVEWSVEKLADTLLEKSREMRQAHRDLVVFTLGSVQPPEPKVATGNDWFAGIRHDPVHSEVPKTSEMLKIRVKHHVRGKKEQGTHWYQPLLLETEKPRVPKFRFHHKEIARNVLTPNTMLKFVPVIRDLRPGEDAQYNTWLKELDRMDASCGFRPMGSREERVIRTTRQEKRASVALFLDYWLDEMAVPECSRSSLIRHMVNQESDNEMTPHQRKVLDDLHSDNNAPTSPRAAKTARMFTEAFDSIFASDHVPVERQITLRDVLLLDKTVDEVTEAKKTVKNAVQEHTPQTYEGFLETYAIMGCLICFSNSCEHGDYGGLNEKRAFSLDANGSSEKMFVKKPGAADKKDHDGTRIQPCQRGCYMLDLDPPCRVAGQKPWSKNHEMLLRSMACAVDCSSRVRSKAQCMVAELLNRECWEVHNYLSGLEKIPIPEATGGSLPRAKTLPWYDRHKKMLLGDWQSETFTHDHKSRINPDPCHHDGPCTAANGCECVLSNVLCERFCLCTAENCSHKFTGCACGSSGKSCLQRAKEGRPCICVQLNRECDPGLCHGCGVRERVDPKNRDNPAIMDSGCQNCVLQRGQSKAVTPGKSQLEGCGYGLFTIEDIATGEFVIEYTGELIMHDEGVRREARRGEAFDDEGNFTSYVFSLLDSEGIWVDAAIYGNHSRYINHEVDDYNIEPKILYVNGEYRIRFTATRNIAAGQELFFNYGGSFPNLTKKMIKDKTKETETSNDQGSPVKRGPGRPKGKGKAKATTNNNNNKRGQEAKAMRKEAPAPEAELSEELVELEKPRPAGVGRGRKRAREVDSVVEESDNYNPSVEDGDGESSSRSRSLPVAQRNKRRRTRGAAAVAPVAAVPPPPRADTADQEETPQPARRGRGKKRQRESDDEEQPEDDLPTPRLRRGRPAKRQNMVRSDSSTPVPEAKSVEATPVKRGRTRQEQPKNHQDTAAEDESVEPQTPVSRPTRYGRRRSNRVADESDDDDLPVPTPRGRRRSPSADEGRSMSDMSSNSRSRRERRLPMRYRDSEEP
ncbi:SET domain-containing protein [Plectosphaerella plurivora]|uniref:SET domain-containing protein n=1 Tax=Plectosphaerella plurivora TaxID=936078 RepID=A0A9P9AD52_9PEZI|nr:SET domain-containing protein [Plectosphaerella plurivora]